MQACARFCYSLSPMLFVNAWTVTVSLYDHKEKGVGFNICSTLKRTLYLPLKLPHVNCWSWMLLMCEYSMKWQRHEIWLIVCRNSTLSMYWSESCRNAYWLRNWQFVFVPWGDDYDGLVRRVYLRSLTVQTLYLS